MKCRLSGVSVRVKRIFRFHILSDADSLYERAGKIKQNTVFSVACAD